MQRHFWRVAVIFGLLFFLNVLVSAQQSTPLSLEEGGLAIDLPLAAGKTYEITVNLRSDLQARVTMTLRYYRENGQVVDYKTLRQELQNDGQWQAMTITAAIPEPQLRWELLLDADQKGMYWWQGLSVASKKTVGNADFWYEKVATEGDFYTGLVVDARHLPVRRGMSPRIYSEGGQLIYGGVLASDSLVQQEGIVAYGSELTDELLNRLKLEGDFDYVSPLVVEAIQAVEPAMSAVYISEEDTQRILEAVVHYDFFARYAVVFLVN